MKDTTLQKNINTIDFKEFLNLFIEGDKTIETFWNG